jgi:phospholipid transport system substrate-binding protein
MNRAAALAMALLLSLLAPGGDAAAAPAASGTPRAAVTSAIDDAVALLHNTAMPVEQRRRELRALAQRNLDLERMAQNVLGTHWTEMTSAQQQEFVPLFEAFLEDAYLGEIQEYSKLKIEVGGETLEGADYARVGATVLQPGEEPIEISFLLERGPRGWLMYDVVIDDIAMISNYRAQFDRVIRNEGLGGLEATLRIKQAKLEEMLGE